MMDKWDVLEATPQPKRTNTPTPAPTPRLISTVDLTRRGLLRVIGYLEVTQLPAPERFNAAINDLVTWVEDHPEDLDRFFTSAPAVPPISFQPGEATEYRTQAETTAAIHGLPSLRSMDLSDYGHAGFKVTLHSAIDWHDADRTDLP